MKNTLQPWDRPKNNFWYQNSALQAACDTSIARVTGCVYPREGYRSVTARLMPGSTGLRRWALFYERKLYNLHWGEQKQTFVEFSMYKTKNIAHFWGGLLSWVYPVCTQVLVCTPCICGRPAEVHSRPDARVVSAVESWWNMQRWTSIATVPEWYLFCALHVMQRHTHTACIDRMKTYEWDLTFCIIRRRYNRIRNRLACSSAQHYQ